MATLLQFPIQLLVRPQKREGFEGELLELLTEDTPSTLEAITNHLNTLRTEEKKRIKEFGFSNLRTAAKSKIILLDYLEHALNQNEEALLEIRGIRQLIPEGNEICNVLKRCLTATEEVPYDDLRHRTSLKLQKQFLTTLGPVRATIAMQHLIDHGADAYMYMNKFQEETDERDMFILRKNVFYLTACQLGIELLPNSERAVLLTISQDWSFYLSFN